MSSVMTDIADAITAELNAASWDLAFTAVRRNLLEVELPDLSTLTVLVVPRTREAEDAARGFMRHTHGTDIGILQRFEQLTVATANAVTDPLFALAEDIQDHLDDATLPGYASAKYAGAQLAFSQERLRDEHVFHAVLTLNFRVIKPR